MRFPYLFRKEISDNYAKDNFTRIADYFRNNILDRCDFNFIEITTTAAVTNTAFGHNLGYVPKDMIIMSITGGATVTVNYDRFTSTTVNITTSAATTIRALIGRYSNG